MTYAVVPPILWRALRGASDRARLLAAYLLTADVRRPAGLLRVPVAHAAADLAWTPRKVEAALAELAAAGFLLRDAGAELVYLAAWRAHDALPNCAAACSAGRQLRDHVREAPDSPAVKAALVAFGEESARLLALAPASDAAAPQLRKLLAALPRGDGPPHSPPDGPPDGARDRRDMDMGMDMGGDLQPCPSNNAEGGSLPLASPTREVAVEIPTRAGTLPVYADELPDMRRLYPELDLAAELREIAGYWQQQDNKDRWTARGARSALHRRLAGQARRARSKLAAPAAPLPELAEVMARA